MTWVISVGAALGLVVTFWGLTSRHEGFWDRLTPYVGPAGRSPWWQRFSPSLGSRGPSHRLSAAGRAGEEKTFLVERTACSVVGAALMALLVARAGPGAAAIAAGLGAVTGWSVRNRWLRREVSRRGQSLREDLPVALDLMSIAIIAGEGVAEALRRAADHLADPLGGELRRCVDEIRAGTSVTDALSSLAARNEEPALARFADALVVGVERGAPIAETFQAQARDLREEERRSLLESGGRREILMLVPIVFLILPVSVVFALYPGLVSLELLVP